MNRQTLNPRNRSGTATGAARFGPALLALLLLSHAAAQEKPAPEPTEPEAHWIYPLGGRPDTRLKAEVEGRLLQEVHAVWSPEPGLKGAILEIQPGFGTGEGGRGERLWRQGQGAESTGRPRAEDRSRGPERGPLPLPGFPAGDLQSVELSGQLRSGHGGVRGYRRG